jgi:hypothetical protein
MNHAYAYENKQKPRLSLTPYIFSPHLEQNLMTHLNQILLTEGEDEVRKLATD